MARFGKKALKQILEQVEIPEPIFVAGDVFAIQKMRKVGLAHVTIEERGIR